ncbi:hypothetical protein V6U78_05355 [Marinospirillum sp. MEB164]|uniref:Uncharacterized protein n=1 Tax=Marinospirillum alkalitolerans TaxID=3123374 RepID=A0ABW8PW36_9GAMM
MKEKKRAIISTILDRQASILDAILSRESFDIITPRLFAETANLYAKKYGVSVYIIEEFYRDLRGLIKGIESNIEYCLESGAADFEEWLEKYAVEVPGTLVTEIARKRINKIASMRSALDYLNDKLEVIALVVNQEYLIHEAVLVDWAKDNNIASIHFCHSPYLSRNMGSIRHFRSDYVTLASMRCSETLDDMQTGLSYRPVTGMINWDVYRNYNSNQVQKLKKDLDIPDDALVVSYFTTYTVVENATSDPETYEKSLDSFMDAASNIIKTVSRPVFFIIKDRPSGVSFIKDRVERSAERLGLNSCLRYCFDRSEPIVMISDITISSGSSIAIESMAMGKAVIELVIRHVFLGGLCFDAHDGVIQVDSRGLLPALKRVIENDDYRKNLIQISSNNEKYVIPTKSSKALQLSTALLFDVFGYSDVAESVRNDDQFYDNLELFGDDHRFYQVDSFALWQQRIRPNELTAQLMGERYNTWKKHPSFHLVMVVDQSLFSALASTLDSLELQMYPHFGLSVISADPCPDAELLNHPKIQWIHDEQPFEQVNQVIEEVEADWIVALWPGDELHPHALFHLADYADLYPDWLVMYGDEVLITPTNEELSDDASRFATSRAESGVFKPDFNLDLLRSTDYVGRSVAFRKDAWKAMDGFGDYAYRQAEELVFRIAERMTLPAIGHIPQMLVHRSTFMDPWVKSSDYEQLGALIRQQHLQRCGFERAEVLPGLHAQIYNTRYHIQDELPPVDLLIAGEGLGEQLASCLRSLQEQQLPRHTQLYITSPANEAQNQQWLIEQGLGGLSPVWVPVDAQQANIAQQWQVLINASQSEHFLLTWDRLRCIQADWLTPLQDQLGRDDVAMVAPRLVSSRSTLLSAGQILGKDGLIGDLYRDFFLEQELKGLPRAWCEQNFNALNPACILIKRSALLEPSVDSRFTGPLAINDVQLQLCTQGKKLMWTPLSSVLMTESMGLGTADDQWQFKQCWFNLLLIDPAFNPHLELRAAGLEPDILLSAPWHPAYRQRAQWLCVVSDPYEGELEAAAPLLKAIEQQQKQEKLQSLAYHFTRLAQERPLTVIELARRAPSVVIYFGRAEEQLELVKKTAQLTQIEQWVVVTDSTVWNEWQAAASHIQGYLVTDPEIFAQQAGNFPCVLISFEEDEQLSRAHLWVEQKVRE